jgi:hypothetical protein
MNARFKELAKPFQSSRTGSGLEIRPGGFTTKVRENASMGRRRLARRQRPAAGKAGPPAFLQPRKSTGIID